MRLLNRLFNTFKIELRGIQSYIRTSLLSTGLFLKRKWNHSRRTRPRRKINSTITCFSSLMYFLTLLNIHQISHKFKQEIVGYLPNELLNILQQYYSILNPEVRFVMVTCLKIFRGKDLVTPQVIMPVLFKLFKCKDKELRKFLHNGLISDLKRLNLEHRNNSINKKM